MKLKYILALGDMLRALRRMLPPPAWNTVYRAVEAFCADHQAQFNPRKWRAWVDRE